MGGPAPFLPDGMVDSSHRLRRATCVAARRSVVRPTNVVWSRKAIRPPTDATPAPNRFATALITGVSAANRPTATPTRCAACPNGPAHPQRSAARASSAMRPRMPAWAVSTLHVAAKRTARRYLRRLVWLRSAAVTSSSPADSCPRRCARPEGTPVTRSFLNPDPLHFTSARPAATGNQPRILPAQARNARERRRDTHALARQARDRSRKTHDHTREGPARPREAHHVAQETPARPLEAHDPARKTSARPQEAHDLPQETSARLQEAHDLPQETSARPLEAHDLARETPARPQEAHDLPQETSARPQEAHDLVQGTSALVRERHEGPHVRRYQCPYGAAP
jgi:hypothetical protein